jgi:hypothetical protein
MICCPALSPKELKLALKNLTGRHALRNRTFVILGVRTGLRAPHHVEQPSTRYAMFPDEPLFYFTTPT